MGLIIIPRENECKKWKELVTDFIRVEIIAKGIQTEEKILKAQLDKYVEMIESKKGLSIIELQVGYSSILKAAIVHTRYKYTNGLGIMDMNYLATERGSKVCF